MNRTLANLYFWHFLFSKIVNTSCDSVLKYSNEKLYFCILKIFLGTLSLILLPSSKYFRQTIPGRLSFSQGYHSQNSLLVGFLVLIIYSLSLLSSSNTRCSLASSTKDTRPHLSKLSSKGPKISPKMTQNGSFKLRMHPTMTYLDFLAKDALTKF